MLEENLKTVPSAIDLTISIVNHDGSEMLNNCLDSIFSQEEPSFKFEVVVADNDSHDDSQTMVKTKYPRVIWAQTGGDRGYGFAHNLGVKNSSGRVILFLANDIKLPPGFFKVLYEKTNGLRVDGFIITMQYNYDGSKELYCGFGMDIFGFPCFHPSVIPDFFGDGGSVIADRRSFIDSGMFDADLFIFYEDIDLYWRARILGYPVFSRPGIVVYHKGGATVAGGHHRGESQYATTAFRRFLNEKNAIRNMIKNYSWPYLFSFLGLYFFISLLEMSFLFLFNRRPAIIKSYLTAWAWNVAHLPDTLKRRRAVQSQRRVSDRQLLKLMYKGYGKYLTLKKIGLPVVK